MSTTTTGFGERLKYLRQAAGFSQQSLATATGLSVFGVAKLEQGAREPGWATVLVLADALDVTPNDFRPITKKRKK
jgi:transcriptional regulator with XRE-family HTH domain